MLAKYGLSLQITPEPSPVCAYLIVTIHVLAIIASIATAIPWVASVICLILISASLAINLKRYVFQAAHYTLRFSDTYYWQICSENNAYRSVTLRGTSVSTPYVVIMHLCYVNGRKQSLLIFKDAVSNEEFRQLRVLVKITSE